MEAKAMQSPEPIRTSKILISVTEFSVYFPFHEETKQQK